MNLKYILHVQGLLILFQINDINYNESCIIVTYMLMTM